MRVSKPTCGRSLAVCLLVLVLFGVDQVLCTCTPPPPHLPVSCFTFQANSSARLLAAALPLFSCITERSSSLSTLFVPLLSSWPLPLYRFLSLFLSLFHTHTPSSSLSLFFRCQFQFTGSLNGTIRGRSMLLILNASTS